MKTFGDMSLEEQEELRCADADGKVIEYYRIQSSTWETTLIPHWAPNTSYRVKPEKDLNKLQIPWGVIDEKWVCAAQDGNSKIYFYSDTEIVVCQDNTWHYKEHTSISDIRLNVILKIKPVADWKQSKTMRGE